MELAIPLGRVIVRLGYHTNKVLRMVLAWRNCSINITYHVVEDSKYPQGVKKKVTGVIYKTLKCFQTGK